MNIIQLILLMIASCATIIDNFINFKSSDITRLSNSNNSSNNALIHYSNQIVIPDSLKIELNNRNIKDDDLFKLVTEHDIDYSLHDNVSQSIISCIVNMEETIKNDNEFRENINSIRSIIEIIKRRIIMNRSNPSKSNIENDSIIKLLTLMDDLDNSNNDSLIPNIREFCHFHSNNESFKIMLETASCDHDPNIVQIISKFIAPFNQRAVGIEMGKIVEDYNHNDLGLKHVYDRLIKDLNLSQKERSKLNFYSSNLVKNLIPIINFPSYWPGWHSLVKFLFKWMVYKREEAISESNEMIFEESINDLKSIASIIKANGIMDMPINFNFQSMNAYDFQVFNSLIRCEFLENHHLFRSLSDAIRDFRDNVNKSKEIACQLLKGNFFNGHFDSDIRFKYLILFHSPIKEMRDCILKDDSQSMSIPRHSPNLSNNQITRKYLENLIIKEPKNFALDLFHDQNYLTRSALIFLQNSDQRFEIKEGYHIFRLLKLLNRENSLTWKMVKSLVGFRIDDESLEWNQDKFDFFVEEFKNSKYIDEVTEFNKYLKYLTFNQLD